MAQDTPQAVVGALNAIPDAMRDVPLANDRHGFPDRPDTDYLVVRNYRTMSWDIYLPDGRILYGDDGEATGVRP